MNWYYKIFFNLPPSSKRFFSRRYQTKNPEARPKIPTSMPFWVPRLLTRFSIREVCFFFSITASRRSMTTYATSTETMTFRTFKDRILKLHKTIFSFFERFVGDFYPHFLIFGIRKFNKGSYSIF